MVSSRYHFSMLKREPVLMPAIDLLDGAVVRLHQGSYDRVTHFGDDPWLWPSGSRPRVPRWLHVIDLGAARDGVRTANHRALIERLAAIHQLELQLGGGIRSAADVEWAIEAGAARVLIGSLAASDPGLVGELATTTGRVAVAADCLEAASAPTAGSTTPSSRPSGFVPAGRARRAPDRAAHRGHQRAAGHHGPAPRGPPRRATWAARRCSRPTT